jgi:hypothetical protein
MDGIELYFLPAAMDANSLFPRAPDKANRERTVLFQQTVMLKCRYQEILVCPIVGHEMDETHGETFRAAFRGTVTNASFQRQTQDAVASDETKSQLRFNQGFTKALYSVKYFDSGFLSGAVIDSDGERHNLDCFTVRDTNQNIHNWRSSLLRSVRIISLLS